MNATRNSGELFEELVQALVEERIEGGEIEIDSMKFVQNNPITRRRDRTGGSLLPLPEMSAVFFSLNVKYSVLVQEMSGSSTGDAEPDDTSPTTEAEEFGWAGG